MASPSVSCIVTCFNLGAFLPETLASIRAQTFRDFEICVIDDGSTDPLTQSALRNLGDDVQVVHSDHRGLPAARNLGVSRTSGEFICAVDADDLLAPTLLERSISRLDKMLAATERKTEHPLRTADGAMFRRLHKAEGNSVNAS